MLGNKFRIELEVATTKYVAGLRNDISVNMISSHWEQK